MKAGWWQIILAMGTACAIAGCAPSASTDSSPSDQISIGTVNRLDTINHAETAATTPPAGVSPASVTPVSAGNLLASGEAGELPSVQIDKAARLMPFVRSQPEAVAPFPIVLNETVQHYVDQYLTQPQGLRGSFHRSEPYMAEMRRILESEGVPRDLVYLAFAESEFKVKGDGPWQLSKETARKFGLVVDHWLDQRRDPIKSTRAAAEYLATLHDETGADWRMTLVAWNNGDSCIARYEPLREASYQRLMANLPYRTRALMNRFMAVALIARHADAYGLHEVNFDQPPPYRMITVRGGTRLAELARREHTTAAELKLLNPGILRDRTSPRLETEQVRVPVAPLTTSLASF